MTENIMLPSLHHDWNYVRCARESESTGSVSHRIHERNTNKWRNISTVRERIMIYQYAHIWLWSIYKEKSRKHKNSCYGDMKVRRRHANEDLRSSPWNQEKKPFNWTQESSEWLGQTTLSLTVIMTETSPITAAHERGTSCESMQTICCDNRKKVRHEELSYSRKTDGNAKIKQ